MVFVIKHVVGEFSSIGNYDKLFSIKFIGEGQLEISINDGDVPNQVQVLGGGKCLVTYTPEQAITHEIEVTFNEEQVTGES